VQKRTQSLVTLTLSLVNITKS